MTGPAATDPGTEVPRRPRSYAVALGLLAVGAGLLFLASGRTWATLVVADAGLPRITVPISGSELTYGQPLALLALAGIAGLVALRRVGRIVAGLVLVLCSLPALVSVVVFGTTHGNTSGAGGWIAGIAGERTGVAVDAAAASVTWWWLVELAGVLLVGVAGALAVVASRDWPRLGRRYERDGTDPRPGTEAQPTAVAGSAWDQLDAGIDPTLDQPPPSEAGPVDGSVGENPPT